MLCSSALELVSSVDADVVSALKSLMVMEESCNVSASVSTFAVKLFNAVVAFGDDRSRESCEASDSAVLVSVVTNIWLICVLTWLAP